MNLPDLAAMVRGATLDDLPHLLGALAEAEAMVFVRLRTCGPQHDPGGTTRAGSEPGRYLTPAEAAQIAGVPVKRIYEWARGKKWAARPTRRCLRVAEGGFRAWLANR